MGPSWMRFNSIQSLSRVWLLATPWTAVYQASLSTSPISGACSNPCPLSWWCHPTISSSVVCFSSYLQSFPESWSFPRSFSFSISPSNEHSGLISFRIDRFDLFAVQGTLKSLLQYHSSKASILRCSAFFTVQLSHPYMTPGKNHSFDYMDHSQQKSLSFLIC